MPVRKLLENFFTLSPALVVGAVCVQTRYFSDPYQGLAYTAQQQSAVTAYIQPVKDVKKLGLIAHPAAAQIRQVAQEWVDGQRTGILKPLLPVSPDDTMAGPIKSVIYYANGELVDYLSQLARAETAHGDALSASRDLQTALDVAEIIKYSDGYALGNLSRRESYLIRSAVALAPKLSTSGRRELASHLTYISERQSEVDRLARIEQLNIDSNVQRIATNDVNAQNPGTATVVGLSDSATQVPAGDRADSDKTANSDLYRAYAAERRFKVLLQAELLKLEKTAGNPQI